LEVAPDAKLVLDIYLTNRNPLVICSDGRKFAVRETCTRWREHAARVRIIRVGAACLICVIGHLVVVPGRDSVSTPGAVIA
jgi:hypothetical protein